MKHHRPTVSRALTALTLALSAYIAPSVFAPAQAEAQCEPEPDVAPQTRTLARNRYAQGVEASQNEDWAAARDAFQGAYDIAPFAPIVYNLATAQVQSGLLVEAAENYRRFLRRCPESSTPEQRTDAQTLLSDVLPRIGSLRLRIENLSVDADAIEIDDQELPPAAIGGSIPVNPGSHTVSVVRDDAGVVGSEEFSVAEGGSATVTIRLPEWVEPTGTGTGAGVASGGGGDDAGLIAGVTIAVVLAVAAAVIIPTVVILSEPTVVGEEPVQGTWEPARLPLVRW